jgi:hypothetical protein
MRRSERNQKRGQATGNNTAGSCGGAPDMHAELRQAHASPSGEGAGNKRNGCVSRRALFLGSLTPVNAAPHYHRGPTALAGRGQTASGGRWEWQTAGVANTGTHRLNRDSRHAAATARWRPDGAADAADCTNAGR